ncbi:lipase, GDXG family [Klebsiella pneumoniae]|uniref:Lipase, GDXG family n=7 Tax=Enterobacterales TaxID=91347 RepID=A0A4P0XH86_KLEPN|nr:lipase, GDXG family [Klebsiella pneumoniae]
MALEKGIASLVEAFIAAGRPSSRDQHIDDRRAGYIASAVLAGETETRVRVEDITLEGMHFRVVSPPTADGLLPTLIYYHGGCFVSGGFATHDNQLRQLAWFSGCRVIAVQYRLAPEYPFPAAHDDAERGATIIHQHAKQLGVDASRITLAGDSAGGHLALVTALRLKAAGTWQPAQLILIYPMLDATASMASYASNGEDYIITRDTLLSGYEMYLAATPATHPDASPLWREDFHGLPAVHILTAEFDPLRDEGEVLYRRLTEQGVESSCQRYLGVIHGFFQLGGVSNAARDAMRDIAWRVHRQDDNCRRRLLFLVAALFVRAKGLRRQHDVDPLENGALLSSPKSSTAFARGLTPARQSVEIAAQRTEVGDALGRPLIGWL